MKIMMTIAAIVMATSTAFGFEATYGLSINKAGKTLTIASNNGNGTIDVCEAGDEMFPAGTYKYSLTGNSLNLSKTTSSGIDFAHVGGNPSTVEGTWNATDEDEGLNVTLVITSSTLTVKSSCD